MFFISRQKVRLGAPVEIHDVSGNDAMEVKKKGSLQRRRNSAVYWMGDGIVSRFALRVYKGVRGRGG